MPSALLPPTPTPHAHTRAQSWDRQLFVTYKGTAATGFYTDYNHLSQNFLLSNYESQEGIDNGAFRQGPIPTPAHDFLNPPPPRTHSFLLKTMALHTTIRRPIS